MGSSQNIIEDDDEIPVEAKLGQKMEAPKPMESYPVDLRVTLKEQGASFVEKLNNEEDE